MVNQGRFQESRPFHRTSRPDPGMSVSVWERIKEVLRNDWEQTKEDFGVAGRQKSDRPSKSHRTNT
jgi:hypothetical protein